MSRQPHDRLEAAVCCRLSPISHNQASHKNTHYESVACVITTKPLVDAAIAGNGSMRLDANLNIDPAAIYPRLPAPTH